MQSIFIINEITESWFEKEIFDTNAYFPNENKLYLFYIHPETDLYSKNLFKCKNVKFVVMNTEWIVFFVFLWPRLLGCCGCTTLLQNTYFSLNKWIRVSERVDEGQRKNLFFPFLCVWMWQRKWEQIKIVTFYNCSKT